MTKQSMKIFKSLLFIGSISLSAFAAEGPNFPFPQHVTYNPDTIFPDQYSQASKDDDVREFYDYWKGEYVVQAGYDAEGAPLYRIALGHPSSSQYGTTVSEGQGYGMLITALMAGYDSEARTIFDGLLQFSKLHRSHIDTRLMAWRVSADDPREGDNDSAFDGDADIALALLLADRQWGSGGTFDYAEDARTLIKAIRRSTTGPDSRLPMLGDWVDVNGPTYNQYTNRTSDFMLANFQIFFKFTQVKRWRGITNRSRRTLRLLQKDYSPQTGLLPDFIVPVSENDHTPKPAYAGFLEGQNDGKYSYNACRVPLRVGLNALLHNSAGSKRIVKKISKWAERHHNGSPYDIHAGYALNGDPLPGTNYLSTAFIAPLGVAAMNVPTQQEWLNTIYDAVNQEHQDYYEDTLDLLSLLVMTGNFWDPTAQSAKE